MGVVGNFWHFLKVYQILQAQIHHQRVYTCHLTACSRQKTISKRMPLLDAGSNHKTFRSHRFIRSSELSDQKLCKFTTQKH